MLAVLFVPFDYVLVNNFQPCLDMSFRLNQYSKICVKRPIKNRQNKELDDKSQHDEGQKYCRMLPLEHSVILLTNIKQ